MKRTPLFVFGGVYFLFMAPLIHSVALSWAQFGPSNHTYWPIYHSLVGLFFMIFAGACTALLQKPFGTHNRTDWLQFFCFFAALQNLMSFLLGPLQTDYVLLLMGSLLAWLMNNLLNPKTSPHDGWISLGMFCGSYIGCCVLFFLLN